MNNSMKELNINEMEQVNGGLIPVLIGAIVVQAALIGTAVGMSIASGKRKD